MSQPKRRSRKSKLVPRSTEGGDPEIEEMIEKEENQIKIVNTMSLAPQPQQRSEAKKTESLQFKVDIEVQEWIDGELFIEENFAKMKSEQLSESLDKEIKEEADWTNDAYAKLWAEVASDSESEEKPHNEYEKLIKNQVDPKLIAGLSKTSPNQEKTVASNREKSNQKSRNFDLIKTYSKKGNAKSQLRYSVKPTQQKVRPKPIVNITTRKKETPPAKVKKIDSSQIVKPVLNINVVFAPPENSKGNPDQSKGKDINTVCNKSNGTDVKNLGPTQSNKNVYLVLAKNDNSNKISNDDESKRIGISNDPEKCSESNKSKTDDMISTTASIDNMEGVLKNQTEYCIKVNKGTEKLNKAQLCHMAYKHVLKQKNELDHSSLTSISNNEKKEDLQHIVVSEDEILSTTDELYKKDDICRLLSVEIRNRLGSVRFEKIKMSREDALIENVFRQWSGCQNSGTSAKRGVPLFYKCYICNDGWWHLEPFRKHIKLHDHLQVQLEKHNQAFNIIAHNTKANSVKFKMFPIDDECWRCGNRYSFHMGSEEGSYQCNSCSSTVTTCFGLLEHMGVCLNTWKKEMERQNKKDIKAFQCKICTLIFFNEEQLLKHQYMYHVPRSDYPMLISVHQCLLCYQNYTDYVYHRCCSKIHRLMCKFCKIHFSSSVALSSHYADTKVNVKCKFCDVVVERECFMARHLLRHTDKFMKVIKCLLCPTNILLVDYWMTRKHFIYFHKQLRGNSIAEIIIPRSLYKGNTVTIESKIAKLPKSILKSVVLSSEPKIDNRKSIKRKIDNNNDDSRKIMTLDDTNEDSSNLETLEPIDDDTNHDSSNLVIQETMPEIKIENVQTTTETMPKINVGNEDPNAESMGPADNTMPQIEIKNEMENYHDDEASNIDTEIDYEQNIPLAKVKIEMDGPESDETDLLQFEHVNIKTENTDDVNPKTSKFITEGKQFTEKLQNFLINMNVEDEAMKECKSANSKSKETECSKCNKVFKNSKKYAKHLSKHGFKLCYCKECDKHFNHLTLWWNHMNTHITSSFRKVNLLSNDTMNNVFICKICKDIVHRNMFFKHWEVHLHQNIKQDVSYENDGSVSKELIESLINCLLEPVKRKMSRSCVACGRAFSRVNEGKRHLVEHLLQAALDICRDNRQVLLRCQVCQAGIDKPDKFRCHMRDHASLPVYHCELCDKTFGDSSNFIKHKKVHNVKAYECDECQKKYMSKSSLIAHIAMHLEEPLKCFLCPDKLFYDESLYRRHVRNKHDKKSMFSCHVCHMRFDCIKDKLDHCWEQHQMRSRLADCPHCDEKFRRYADLKRHMTQVHGVKTKFSADDLEPLTSR